ncbi:MAG TPA: proton-conducting transporter membrane subunit, partial [Elusimicrobiales bacterium]|nr:proton-conducting transporter membrane subunit [Elusimicrobiales bacterium]
QLDALSALFLAPLFILCAAGAVYSLRYVNSGKHWSYFLYNMLAASMALVFTANNAVLFLIAWEVMTIASFLFVVWDQADPESAHAGWLYLVATHIGTAFLLVLFTSAWSRCGSGDFAAFPLAFRGMPFAAVAVLSLLGFGTKAGFFPLHVWLPKAHPAAPSHISALMSGIMIKTGIYGLLRMVSLCPPAPQWFGWLLLGIGLVSGLLGAVFVLAQRDFKQLLAYSSVENVGVVAIGLGLGYAGLACGRNDVAFLGFAGGLWHVVNHAFFKSLLFFGAGSVYHAAGTRDLEQLGGLGKAMPVTAACSLAGCAAISALPPFNGFISELLIYLGAFALLTSAGANVFAGLAALTGLAAIGALAVAGFARAFGVVFLGLPRKQLQPPAHEAPGAMRLPMLALAALCACVGLAPLAFAPFIFSSAAVLLPVVPETGRALDALSAAGWSALILWVLAVLLWSLRNWLLSRRKNGASPTWDCGYAAPGPSMQYTASSFA